MTQLVYVDAMYPSLEWPNVELRDAIRMVVDESQVHQVESLAHQDVWVFVARLMEECCTLKFIANFSHQEAMSLPILHFFPFRQTSRQKKPKFLVTV